MRGCFFDLEIRLNIPHNLTIRSLVLHNLRTVFTPTKGASVHFSFKEKSKMRKFFTFALFVTIAAFFAACQTFMPTAWWGPTAMAIMLVLASIATYFIILHDAGNEVGLFLLLASGFGASCASWLMPGFASGQIVWISMYMLLGTISAYMAVYRSKAFTSVQRFA
jgi:hypothetical protein